MPDLQTCIPTDFTFQQIECIVLNVGTDNASPQMEVVYRDFFGGIFTSEQKRFKKDNFPLFCSPSRVSKHQPYHAQKTHPKMFSAVFMNLGIIFVSDD